LQHLFYFIAQSCKNIIAAIKQNNMYFIAALFSCAINAAIYFIAAFIEHETTT